VEVTSVADGISDIPPPFKPDARAANQFHRDLRRRALRTPQPFDTFAVRLGPGDRGHSRPLASGRDPAARRQPLLHARSAPFLPRNRVDYALGVATTATLRHHIDTPKNTVTRLAAARVLPTSSRTSRNSTTAPRAGIASNASSPASKLDPTVWAREHSARSDDLEEIIC
jgi:hypothetical protein